VPVAHINEGRSSIVSPIRHTITNGKANQIRLEYACIAQVGLVEVVDFTSQVWDVDASIRFTGEVKFVSSELGVQVEPGEDGVKILDG